MEFELRKQIDDSKSKRADKDRFSNKFRKTNASTESIFKVKAFINKSSNKKLGETLNSFVAKNGMTKEMITSPSNPLLRSPRSNTKKNTADLIVRKKDKNSSVYSSDPREDKRYDLEQLASLYIKPGNKNALKPKMKMSALLLKKVSTAPGNDKPIEKLNELNQLYNANVMIKNPIKKKPSDKLLLPQLKTDSSVNNTQNNSNINITSSTRGITPTKRQSKSYNLSNVENLLSRESSVSNINNIKNVNQHRKKIEENINISQLPELMSNLMKNKSSKDPPTNNIINIVNNVDPNNDKKIAFKVNVNQYDIKYYVPSKKDNKKREQQSLTDEGVTDNKTYSEVDITDQVEETHRKLIEINKSKDKKKDKDKDKDNLSSFYSILQEEMNRKNKSSGLRALIKEKEKQRYEDNLRIIINQQEEKEDDIKVEKMEIQEERKDLQEEIGDAKQPEDIRVNSEVIEERDMDEIQMPGDVQVDNEDIKEIKDILHMEYEVKEEEKEVIQEVKEHTQEEDQVDQIIKLENENEDILNDIHKLESNDIQEEDKNIFIIPTVKSENKELLKLTSVAEEECLNKTGTFLVKENKPFPKMKTAVESSTNVLPKYHLPKTMSLNVNKIKANIHNLNITTKSKETGSNLITDDNFSHNLFQRGNTHLNTDTQNSDGGDITFNNNLNQTNILKLIEKSVKSNSNSSQKNVNKNNFDNHLLTKFASFGSIKIDENLISDKERSEPLLPKKKTTTEEVEEIENDFSQSSSFDSSEIIKENLEEKKEIEVNNQEEGEVGEDIKEKVHEIINKIEAQSLSEVDNNEESNIQKDNLTRNNTLSYFKLKSNFKSKIGLANVNIKNTLLNKRNSTPLKGLHFETYMEEIAKLILNLKKKPEDEILEKSYISSHSSSHSSGNISGNINRTKVKLTEMRTFLKMKLSYLETLSDNSKESLLITSRKHIKRTIKEHVRVHLEEMKRLKNLSFYKEGFKNQVNNLINEEKFTFENMDPPDNVYKPISMTLFQNFNDFLANKYFDLFKELLMETFNSDYETDIDGNKKGRSVLENFRIAHDRNVDFNKIIPKVDPHLFKTTKSGLDMIRFIGLDNHMYINNFVVRDCINMFQEELLKDMIMEGDISKDEETGDNKASIKKKKTQMIFKRKSDMQILGSLREAKKNSAFLLHPQNLSFKNINNSSVKSKMYLDNDNDNDSGDGDSPINFKSCKTKIENKERIKNLKNEPTYVKGYKRKIDPSPIENKDKITKFTVLNNRRFVRNRDWVKSQDVKRNDVDNLELHFQESSYLPMTKENTIYRTYEIKSNIVQILKTPAEQLSFYIKDGNFSKFKDIFEKKKVNVNTTDADGNSLLTMAVQSESYEIAQYLLNVGAEVNLQNIHLNSPLHYALSHKNFKMANLLISKKADEALMNKKGLTPWQCLGLDTKEVDRN